MAAKQPETVKTPCSNLDLFLCPFAIATSVLDNLSDWIRFIWSLIIDCNLSLWMTSVSLKTKKQPVLVAGAVLKAFELFSSAHTMFLHSYANCSGLVPKPFLSCSTLDWKKKKKSWFNFCQIFSQWPHSCMLKDWLVTLWQLPVAREKCAFTDQLASGCWWLPEEIGHKVALVTSRFPRLPIVCMEGTNLSAIAHQEHSGPN